METLLDCGHPPSPHLSCTTGYGLNPIDGKRSCYKCCAAIDATYMKEKGRIALYLTESGVTNWPGSLSFPVLARTKGGHNIAQSRYDVWFRGPDNFIWHGVQYGENTQICHCRRTKKQKL